MYLTIVDNQICSKENKLKKLTFHDMNNRSVAITMLSKITWLLRNPYKIKELRDVHGIEH